jgi:hypothetical protein
VRQEWASVAPAVVTLLAHSAAACSSLLRLEPAGFVEASVAAIAVGMFNVPAGCRTRYAFVTAEDTP